jgi:hypothetical protein
MPLLSSSPRSTSSKSHESSTCSTPPNPQITPSTSVEQDETITLQENYRGQHYSSKLVQLTDHPIVRVTSTDLNTTSFLPSSNDLNDGIISTFRDRSRSPRPHATRDKEELQSETFDHPLSTSWWGEGNHMAKPWRDPKKKRMPSEQTEALQTTRKVSNSIIPDSFFPSMDSEDQVECCRNSFDASLSNLLTIILESRTSHRICAGNGCRHNPRSSFYWRRSPEFSTHSRSSSSWKAFAQHLGCFTASRCKSYVT